MYIRCRYTYKGFKIQKQSQQNRQKSLSKREPKQQIFERKVTITLYVLCIF